MKTKKKVLSVVSLAFALSLATAGAVNSAIANAAGEAYAIDAGASIKVVSTTDESAVDAETGIRFSATVTPAFVETLGENDYVGMMIVPSKVITAYNNQDGDVEVDYLQFIANVKGVEKAQVEADVACTYAKSALHATKDTTIYGVIASVQDAHYSDDYQAVAYYVKDGAYTYIGASEASTIVEVADTALLDDAVLDGVEMSEYKNALGNIIEKSIVVSTGLELDGEACEITLTDTDTVDVQAMFSGANVDVNNIGLTVEKNNSDHFNSFIEVDDETCATKISMVGEWLDVTVSAYDGMVSIPLSISYTPTVQDVSWSFKDVEDNNKEYTCNFTTYGASAIDENGGVTLAAGSYTGKTENAMGTADVPYVAVKGEYGGATAEAIHVLIDFTGCNLPNIAFFTDQPDENTKNIVGRNGALFSSGVADKDGEYGGDYDNRLQFYGAPFFTSSDGATVASAKTPWHTLKSSAGVVSNVVFTENPTKQYRLVLSMYPKTAASKSKFISYTWALLEKNTAYDGTEGTYPYSIISYCAKQSQVNIPESGAYTAGGIVIYGRPYDDTKIDGMQILGAGTNNWADSRIATWTGTKGLW